MSPSTMWTPPVERFGGIWNVEPGTGTRFSCMVGAVHRERSRIGAGAGTITNGATPCRSVDDWTRQLAPPYADEGLLGPLRRRSRSRGRRTFPSPQAFRRAEYIWKIFVQDHEVSPPCNAR